MSLQRTVVAALPLSLVCCFCCGRPPAVAGSLANAQWPTAQNSFSRTLRAANSALERYRTDYGVSTSLLDCDTEDDATWEMESDALVTANGLCESRTRADDPRAHQHAVSEFREMTKLVDNDFYLCADIYHDDIFVRALKQIDLETDPELLYRRSGIALSDNRANRTQVAMATVFAHVHRLVYSAYGLGQTTYGCTEVSSGGGFDIFLYPSACEVRDIYGYGITRITPATRVQFVVAHEIGHVIDELAHELHNPSADREVRATTYATFLIQCRARGKMQFATESLASGLEVPVDEREFVPEANRFRSGLDLKRRYCDLQRAYALNEGLTRVHVDLRSTPVDSGRSQRLVSAFACSGKDVQNPLSGGPCPKVAADLSASPLFGGR